MTRGSSGLFGEIMPTHLVNLDALIRRENFEILKETTESATGREFNEVRIEDLQSDSGTFQYFRKPDFQRVTADWTPERIVDFVASFLDRKFIPALIMWWSQIGGKIFVIDGSHRLSALIAWVNNDYGDGPNLSAKLFGASAPSKQIKLAARTRALIEEKIGTYNDLRDVRSERANPRDELSRERAQKGLAQRLPIQWILGDASAAEDSFFKINLYPAIIDPTELNVIYARKKPNAIATRAIIQAGSGYKYWSGFKGNIVKIENLSKRVFDLLFGEYSDITSQSPDLPRAGQPYAAEAFSMVLDVVNLFNDVTPAMWQLPTERSARSRKLPTVSPLSDDIDGTATLEFLRRVEEIAELVGGNEDGAFGLDPAVYYYGATGLFHSAALIATLKLANEMVEQKKKYEFTTVRAKFEEFLVAHKSFINDLAHSKGSRTRAVDSLLTMYRVILKCLWQGIEDFGEIVKQLKTDKRFEDLKYPAQTTVGGTGRKFSKTVQNAAILRDTLNHRSNCNECGARLPPYARSKDHIIPREEHGPSTLENLQFTHSYCNTGYKEAKRHGLQSAKPEALVLKKDDIM
jgi:hypothetical protein